LTRTQPSGKLHQGQDAREGRWQLMRGGVRRRGAARRPCAAPTQRHRWLAGARACARSRRRMAPSLRATGAAWAWSRRVRWRATAGATRSYCSRPHACAALTAIGGRGSAALDQGPVAEATERGHHVSVIPLLSLVVGVTPMLFTIFSGAFPYSIMSRTTPPTDAPCMPTRPNTATSRDHPRLRRLRLRLRRHRLCDGVAVPGAPARGCTSSFTSNRAAAAGSDFV
jgi:hypothetical protein